MSIRAHTTYALSSILFAHFLMVREHVCECLLICTHASALIYPHIPRPGKLFGACYFFCRCNFRLSEVIRAKQSVFRCEIPPSAKYVNVLLLFLPLPLLLFLLFLLLLLEASACLLANILVVKRCNQILCSMCGSYIIGKPDHSEVLSAVPVSGRNCNQFSINICYSCAATDWVDFSTKKALKGFIFWWQVTMSWFDVRCHSNGND